MKKNLLFLLLLVNEKTIAQQLSHLDLIAFPIKNEFVISGVGGGNLQELNLKSGASSAQFSIDWNVVSIDGKPTKKGKSRLHTHTTLVKCNPVLSTRLLKRDSLPARKLPMVDNEHLVQFGYRYRSLTELNTSEAYKSSNKNSNADLLQNAYLDLMYTPYNIDFTDATIGKFSTLNVNTGYQIGFLKSNTVVGNIAICLSGQANMISIIETSKNFGSFDKTYKSLTKLPRTFIGFGGKILFQLNDFALHLEIRKYISVENKNVVHGLNDNLIISFGFAATGTAFQIGKKDNTSRW